MKKIILSLIALFVAFPFVWAVPADPTPFKYTQPDGTVIILVNHGDEFFNWVTDVNGTVMDRGADGFFRPSTESLSARAARSAQVDRRGIQRRKWWSSYEDHPATNIGSVNILCVLIEFSDPSSVFTIEDPRTHFTNMLNQEGYSYNGAIGSVRDYYVENSFGQYIPTFEVYGPVKVSQEKAYCGDPGNNPRRSKIREAIAEALQTLYENGTITDISKYDNDNDGALDMVLCYYPGHNPAEGGDFDNVWPHQSSMSGSVGGKTLGTYFCTSEMRGDDECNEAAAIGTTCHEFAHSLGLPDFYDVDYNLNGWAVWTTGSFDLMSSGNYNDNGRRPPYLSVLERNMLGWAPAPALLSTSGNYSLNPVQAGSPSKNESYRLDTSNPGEYFIMEYRNASKWDSTLPGGLILYQVDCSERIVSGSYTAKYLWENTNNINAYGAHPCYRLVPQIDPPTTDYYEAGGYYYTLYNSEFVFPGRGPVTSFTPLDWEGHDVRAHLSSIADNGTNATFTVNFDGKVICGYVRDKNGVAVSGARVILSQSAYPFAAAPALLPTDKTTTTDANGYYSFELEVGDTDYQIVTVQKDGYVSVSLNVTAGSLFSGTDFVLFEPDDGGIATLRRYDSDKSMYSSDILNSSSAAGFYYSAGELAEMKAVGSSLESVSFLSFAKKQDFEKAYVIVDAFVGEEHTRLLEKDITEEYVYNKWVTIDVSGSHITIPEGADICVGYGFTGYNYTGGDSYPFAISGPDGEMSYGNCMLDDFLQSSDWYVTDWSGDYYSFVVSARLGLKVTPDFSTHGVSFIRLSEGVPTVAPAAGKTVKSISWSIDGTPVDGAPSAVSALTAGSHTYMARIEYYDGTAERVYYDIDVE